MDYLNKIDILTSQINRLEEKVSAAQLPTNLAFQKFYSFVNEKKDNFKPSIMVYGIYNAGKSSLVNALFGEEVSKVSDKAETCKVQKYEYKGFSLYDTPGLNAPIEHETVTREHYKKCEIILFVVSNDSHESAPIYDELEKILKEKKPLIIVINKKTVGEDEEKDKNRSEIIVQKIQENLAKKNIPNIDKLYNLVEVNAKSALKAKLEGKELLLEKSNIKELESRLLDILKVNRGEDVLNVIQLYLIDFLNDLMSSVNQKINDAEIESLADLYTNITKQKKSAKLYLKNKIEEGLAPIVSSVADLGENLSEESVKSIVNENLESLNTILAKEFEEIIKQLGTSFSYYSLNVKKLFNASDVKINENSQGSALSKTVDDLANLALSNLNNPEITAMIQETAKEATLSALKSIKTWLPSLMKGKGQVWMSNFANSFSKYLGPALTIVSIAYGKYAENAAAEREVDRKRSIYLEIINKMKTMVNKISDGLLDAVSKNLNELFDPKIDEIKKDLDSTTQKNEQLTNIRNEITSILNGI